MGEINEIYNQIGGAAATEAALNELDISGDTATSFRNDVSNSSVVGRFRLVAWLVALYCFFQRAYFRTFRRDVVELAKNGHYGTKRWYIAKALEFQYGSAIQFTDKDAYYDPVNPAARIVTHAAVVETAYKAIVKVAKTNSTGGGLTYLNTVERTALQDYFDEIKPVVQVEVRSSKPDLVKIIAVIITDAKLGTPTIQANVEAAIQNYLRTLDFNGAIRRLLLQQAILAVPGVLDVDIQDLALKININAPWMPINLRSVTYAGHAVISSDYPLEQALSYVSQNV